MSHDTVLLRPPHGTVGSGCRQFSLRHVQRTVHRCQVTVLNTVIVVVVVVVVVVKSWRTPVTDTRGIKAFAYIAHNLTQYMKV